MTNSILISSDSRYPISRPKIKKAIETTLSEQGITSVVEISVLICGRRQALLLAKKYLHDDKPHNVLSFCLQESFGQASLNQERLVLGDIAVCYPIAQQEANSDNMLVDDKINELVCHGLMHLMGIHH